MLTETKSISEISSEHGIHSTQLHRWRKEFLEKAPEVFSREAGWVSEKSQYENKIEDLYTEIGKLTTELSWLKKRCMLLSRSERVALLDWERSELPLKTQAQLLGLNRSSLYYVPKPPSEEEIRIKHTIDRIFTAHPYYGSRRQSRQ